MSHGCTADRLSTDRPHSSFYEGKEVFVPSFLSTEVIRTIISRPERRPGKCMWCMCVHEAEGAGEHTHAFNIGMCTSGSPDLDRRERKRGPCRK